MNSEYRKRGGTWVLLTCGHKIVAVNGPRHAGQKYTCMLGTGCGYSLSWVSSGDMGSQEPRIANDAFVASST